MNDVMISLRDVVKTFADSGEGVHAVRKVSLDIHAGEIFGIVGFSGAGKSTLVRCMNLLERPNSGTVTVDGVELTGLSAKALNRERRKMGMIFQQFNLFASRPVLDNVMFPLKHTGMSRETMRRKAQDLLAFVELSDKADAYPSQLSGGQKQRVAIARALASDPKVLLCDEATSALDPQTTTSILNLLRRLNRERGITIVVITHQMQVVKELCQRVALMEAGRIVEEGDVYDIFANPREPITRSFVESANASGQMKEVLKDPSVLRVLESGAKLYCFKFLDSSAGRALVSAISRQYQIDLSILQGNIEMIDGRSLGQLLVAAEGDADRIGAAMQYAVENGVEVEEIQNA